MKLIILTMTLCFGFIIPAVPLAHAGDSADIISNALVGMLQGKNKFRCPSGYHRDLKSGPYMCAPDREQAISDCPTGYVFARKGSLIGCMKPDDASNDGGSGYDSSTDNGAGYDSSSEGVQGYYDGSGVSDGAAAGVSILPPPSRPRVTVHDRRTRPPVVVHDRRTCSKYVQGKIAWDYKGHTSWSPSNINRLCRGAEQTREPAICFNRVMHGGVNYGGGTKWKWKNAIDLCKGSQNARATISCFENRIKRRSSWQSAIRSCNQLSRPRRVDHTQAGNNRVPPRAVPRGSHRPPVVVHDRRTCSKYVQGKIAWDYKGHTSWSPSNINRLCRGAEQTREPAICFNRVMHGGVNYGGGTKWKWKNAIDLCKGSQNARATISCFENRIKRRSSWKSAIRSCNHLPRPRRIDHTQAGNYGEPPRTAS